jgi:hypothetical protein
MISTTDALSDRGTSAGDFFQLFDRPSAHDDEEFWSDLQERFGMVAAQLREAIALAASASEPARRAAYTQRVYDLKNEDLDLALAVVARFRGSMFGRLWRAMDAFGPDPTEIADLGCDVGIVTCYLAHRYPNAVVVGVDRNRKALLRAEELARRLGLTNIRFERADLRTDLPKANWSFDLVIAINVFEHVLRWPPALGYFSLGEVRLPEPDRTARGVVSAVAGLLSPGGQFLSVEYFRTAAQHLWWVRLLNDRGLSIAWDRSAAIRIAPDPNVPASAMLVTARRLTNTRIARIDDFRASALIPHLEVASERTVFFDEVAEVLFDAISEKSLVRGFEAIYQRPGSTSPSNAPVAERDELWQAGPLLLSRRVSNVGDRRLELRSALAATAAIEELERFAELLAGEYEAGVRWYGS